MPNKAFLEITNVCNLNCSFCHGTKREKAFMTASDFRTAAFRLRSFADYLYFHLMGEPLLHPGLKSLFDIAEDLEYKVIITTNGTLLKQKEDILLSSPALHKVSISLHCYEANDIGIPLDEYLEDCFSFCEKASRNGIISVMRLWNIGGKEDLNEYIIGKMKKYFGNEWKEIYSGYKIKEKVFLEWGEKFDWPDENGEYISENHSCYGLRDQIGVLCDGTVVPCCLDADGAVPLGNIFENTLEEILSSKRAVNLKNSFINKHVCEELCKKCGYGAKR